MDAHALRVLEYPTVLERVAAAAATPVGRALAAALEPSPDADEVARRQALTAEAIALYDVSGEPALGGVDDVRPHAEHAAREGLLGPAELREVALAVAVALRAQEELDAEAAPLLADLLAPLDPALDAVREAVERAVEEDGTDLRDDASPELASLRRELRGARRRIAAELERVARSVREHLQETFLTEREGRPVLAVKVSARGRVPGIVHDASTSGQTVFVEPLAVVELGNRLAETAAAEREEAERILRELSARVGQHAEALEALVEAVAALDLALARGAVSRGWRGAEVRVGDEVALLRARHPLLPRETAVPIDLDLGPLRALVVSGPNTGGKTVALKTLGLAALLHQAGLRPPAEEAALPVFDEVLADIGDQQSIEMSLSTFSAHLTTILRILETASARSLVLLDELAAGTDPDEGSALAQALVARLARQARLVAVTTHYPELKEWASAAEGAVNAATAFDPETGEPLYEVALGRPGTSHALRVAERLGLDAEVVADARSRLDPERLRTAELVAEAEAAARAAAEERTAARGERAAAERLAAEARGREAELQAEIERVRESAERERAAAIERAERELAEARRELEALREEIRIAQRRERQRRRSPEAERVSRSGAGGEAGTSALDRLRQVSADRDRHLGEASTRARRAEQNLRRLAEPLPVLAPLAVGDPVEAPELGVRGTIASIDGEQAEVVAAGGFRVRVPLARLRPSRVREPEQPVAQVRVMATARDASDQLDVRGMRAQDAREAVRQFVDDASLAGLEEVHVIHGRGTGAVRAAVREELARHPLVSKTEPESRDGATLARLG